MALAFELVVNYGRNYDGLQDARCRLSGVPPIKVGRHAVRLHEPLVRELPGDPRGRDRPLGAQPYAELSILPVAVGHGVAIDRGLPNLRLTADELTELGHNLYRLLKRLAGYQAAMVGWDPEVFVDLDELRADWAEELHSGALPGLVLSDATLEALRAGVGFQPFVPGFEWIPYRGEHRT